MDGWRGATAGGIEDRKRNSTLQQSTLDALLKKKNDRLRIQYVCLKLAAVSAVMDEALHVTE